MATQHVNCSYQEIIDLHTESDTVSVVGIHTPTGDVPKQLFSGFYKQFKKFKYNGCSIALVPAARLPADPLQVSYEAGEPTIDPRDMLNPIMFHGCHGNDMGAILNSLYAAGSVGFPLNSSTDGRVTNEYVGRTSSTEITAFVDSGDADASSIATSLYYKALTDNTWAKAHPLKGFRKNGLRPLVYNLATTHQILNQSGANGTTPTIAEYIDGNPTFFGSGNLGPSDIADNNTDHVPTPSQPGTANQALTNDSTFSTAARSLMRVAPVPVGGGFSGTSGNSYYTFNSLQFMTNKLQSLGWLDTHNIVQTPNTSSSNVSTFGTAKNAFAATWAKQWVPATLPRVYMGMLMLPPAYKTEQYFRLVINHNFSFKGFRGISMQNENVVETLEVPSYFNANNPYNASDGVPIDEYHADTGMANPLNPLN